MPRVFHVTERASTCLEHLVQHGLSLDVIVDRARLQFAFDLLQCQEAERSTIAPSFAHATHLVNIAVADASVNEEVRGIQW